MKNYFILIIWIFLSVNLYSIPVKKEESPQRDHYYKDFKDMDEHFDKMINEEHKDEDSDDLKRRKKKS